MERELYFLRALGNAKRGNIVAAELSLRNAHQYYIKLGRAFPFGDAKLIIQDAFQNALINSFEGAGGYIKHYGKRAKPMVEGAIRSSRSFAEILGAELIPWRVEYLRSQCA